MSEPTVEDRDELIRWLALTYGDNDPLFGFADEQGIVDQQHNERLRATWLRVVRGTDGP